MISNRNHAVNSHPHPTSMRKRAFYKAFAGSVPIHTHSTLSQYAEALLELRWIAGDSERRAKRDDPVVYKQLKRLVERDHAVVAARLYHRIYLRAVSGRDVVRARHRVDEKLARGHPSAVLSRQKMLGYDTAQNERELTPHANLLVRGKYRN